MTYENNADSLVKNNNNNNNHVVILPSKPDKSQTADGGFHGYLVMICAFMCNGILFGIINSYSVVYLSLQRQLEKSGDPLASSKACKSIFLMVFIFLRKSFMTCKNQRCDWYGFECATSAMTIDSDFLIGVWFFGRLSKFFQDQGES